MSWPSFQSLGRMWSLAHLALSKPGSWQGVRYTGRRIRKVVRKRGKGCQFQEFSQGLKAGHNSHGGREEMVQLLSRVVLRPWEPWALPLILSNVLNCTDIPHLINTFYFPIKHFGIFPGFCIGKYLSYK